MPPSTGSRNSCAERAPVGIIWHVDSGLGCGCVGLRVCTRSAPDTATLAGRLPRRSGSEGAGFRVRTAGNRTPRPVPVASSPLSESKLAALEVTVGCWARRLRRAPSQTRRLRVRPWLRLPLALATGSRPAGAGVFAPASTGTGSARLTGQALGRGGPGRVGAQPRSVRGRQASQWQDPRRAGLGPGPGPAGGDSPSRAAWPPRQEPQAGVAVPNGQRQVG